MNEENEETFVHTETYGLIEISSSSYPLQLCNEEDWVMQIDNDGIQFNRVKFPDWKPDDFALEVIGILEKSRFIDRT